MKNDYYDGLIQERGSDVAAPLLADECRKADVEIATLKARLEGVFGAIDAEPELPGEMPPAMHDRLVQAMADGDLDLIAEAMRITVRLTKRGIRDRIEAITPNKDLSLK